MNYITIRYKSSFREVVERYAWYLVGFMCGVITLLILFRPDWVVIPPKI